MNKNLNNGAISEEMYDWILKNLPKGSTILEFGSGTGIIELTKYYTVYSIEESKKWLGLAKKAQYIYAPLKSIMNSKWYDHESIFDNLPEHYDLILIDGPKVAGYRIGIVHFLGKLNTKVPILIDDTRGLGKVGIRLASTLCRRLEHKKSKQFEGHQKNFSLLYD